MSTIQQFDLSVDLLKALLWQHNSAPALKTIIQKKQEWYDTNQRDFWANWMRDVFDLNTANEFGLNVWSRILGVPLSVQIEPSISKAAFGFGTNHQNFENGNFARAFAGDQVLNPDQARLVLKLRYLQLITRGAIAEVNEWLAALFGDQGVVFAVDGVAPMTAVYFFTFTPDAQLRFVLEKFDILPRPAAVGVTYQVQIDPSWGFGVNHLNFENGNFGA